MDECVAIERALTVFGRAWAAAVLQALSSGAVRFSEIRRAIPAVTDTVLSSRLRELCAAGLVEREVAPGPPVLVNYRLTARGRAAEPVLRALADFGRGPDTRQSA
mgnify:CR=1 FL=1